MFMYYTFFMLMSVYIFYIFFFSFSTWFYIFGCIFLISYIKLCMSFILIHECLNCIMLTIFSIIVFRYRLCNFKDFIFFIFFLDSITFFLIIVSFFFNCVKYYFLLIALKLSIGPFCHYFFIIKTTNFSHSIIKYSFFFYIFLYKIWVSIIFLVFKIDYNFMFFFCVVSFGFVIIYNRIPVDKSGNVFFFNNCGNIFFVFNLVTLDINYIFFSCFVSSYFQFMGYYCNSISEHGYKCKFSDSALEITAYTSFIGLPYIVPNLIKPYLNFQLLNYFNLNSYFIFTGIITYFVANSIYYSFFLNSFIVKAFKKLDFHQISYFAVASAISSVLKNLLIFVSKWLHYFICGLN